MKPKTPQKDRLQAYIDESKPLYKRYLITRTRQQREYLYLASDPGKAGGKYVLRINKIHTSLNNYPMSNLTRYSAVDEIPKYMTKYTPNKFG